MNRDSTSNTITFNVTAQNDAPTASHGGTYLINEGNSLNLDASGSSDVDGDTLTYRWDLDNDGQYDDLISTSATATVAWSTLSGLGIDDDGVYSIGLQVDDGSGGQISTSTTLTVQNVAPTLTASGSSIVTGGTSYTLNLSATDPGNDTITQWMVNWGDGTITTHAGNPASVTHVFSNTRSGMTFDITVSAVDEDGHHFGREPVNACYGGDYARPFMTDPVKSLLACSLLPPMASLDTQVLS